MSQSKPKVTLLCFIFQLTPVENKTTRYPYTEELELFCPNEVRIHVRVDIHLSNIPRYNLSMFRYH